MTKKERLSIILNLINSEEICTQEELTERLNSLGHNVSQSTVSRDINELNLIKSQGKNKKSIYVHAGANTKTASPQIIGLLKQIIVSVDSANNLVVIKTLAGNAGSAGMAVDQMHFPQVIGTVAGDDTLLVVAKTNSDADVIVKTLRNL
ncbi:MAG: arginine repressor [Clostridiales bacterium]|nr:arginine repressor [Clostridiales bacterium]